MHSNAGRFLTSRYIPTEFRRSVQIEGHGMIWRGVLVDQSLIESPDRDSAED